MADPVRLRSRIWCEWATTTLIGCMVVVTLSLTGWTSRFDNLIYDAAITANMPDISDKILIIGIDEESLARVGKWPWRRDEFATGLDQIGAASPKAVAFDLLLSEPSNLQSDARLAASMQKLRRVYLPVQVLAPGPNGAAYEILSPAPVFRDAARGLGNVNVFTDSDGSVRRLAPCFGGGRGGTALPHLMRALTGAGRMHDCARSELFRFAPLPEYQYASWASLAAGEVPAIFLRDRYILIGATAEGLGDRYIVPEGSDGTMSGIVVMANYLNAILRDGFIREIGRPWHLCLSVLPLILLMFAQLRFRPRTIIAMLLAGLAGLALITVGLLTMRIWFAPGPAIAGLLLVYPLWGWRRLQAAIDHMADEVRHMQGPQYSWARKMSGRASGDLLGQQSALLSAAIAELQDLRRFVTDSLTQLPDPLLVIDTQQSILLANDAAHTVFGSDVEGTDVRDNMINIIAPQDVADALAYLQSSIIAGNGNAEYHEFTASNGQEFAMRCVAVLDKRGAQRGHIVYLADITAIAAAQREREAVLQLLSHDMRAPQSAILALVEQMSPSGDVAKRIAVQAHRTLGLADNFVDLARMQTVSFDPEDILLHDLLREAADGLWPLASSRAIQFQFDDQSDDAFILGERSSLFRAFTNIFDNAIKFSPDGGIISVAISEFDGVSSPMLRIRIADQGPGIADDLIETLFQRFSTHGGRGTTRVKGIGLGLHYVETVILRHGGSIAAHNRLPVGAEFIVELARAE